MHGLLQPFKLHIQRRIGQRLLDNLHGSFHHDAAPVPLRVAQNILFDGSIRKGSI